MGARMSVPRNKNALDELKVFKKELKSYQRWLKAKKKLSEAQLRYRESLRDKLVRKCGQFRSLVAELTGKDTVIVYEFGKPRSVDMWAMGLRVEFDYRTDEALGACIDNTNEAIGKLESDIKTVTIQKQPNIVVELASFQNELREYHNWRQAMRGKKLTAKQIEHVSSLRRTLVKKVGKYKNLVTEITGIEKVPMIISHKEFLTDIWTVGLLANPVARTPVALSICIDTIGQTIGKLEVDIEVGHRDRETGYLITLPAEYITEPPKAFIAHTGETKALEKLKNFLDAIGIQYLVAEFEPSNGRSVEGQVTQTYGEADFAIILATKAGVIDKKTGAQYMGVNVADELGRTRVVFKNKIILLLEQGVDPHTNIGEIVHERFTPQSMDKAFVKIAKELKNWGFIRAERVR